MATAVSTDSAKRALLDRLIDDAALFSAGLAGECCRRSAPNARHKESGLLVDRRAVRRPGLAGRRVRRDPEGSRPDRPHRPSSTPARSVHAATRCAPTSNGSSAIRHLDGVTCRRSRPACRGSRSTMPPCSESSADIGRALTRPATSRSGTSRPTTPAGRCRRRIGWRCWRRRARRACEPDDRGEGALRRAPHPARRRRSATWPPSSPPRTPATSRGRRRRACTIRCGAQHTYGFPERLSSRAPRCTLEPSRPDVSPRCSPRPIHAHSSSIRRTSPGATLRLEAEQVARGAVNAVFSFGSCSFDEPVKRSARARHVVRDRPARLRAGQPAVRDRLRCRRRPSAAGPSRTAIRSSISTRWSDASCSTPSRCAERRRSNDFSQRRVTGMARGSCAIAAADRTGGER